MTEGGKRPRNDVREVSLEGRAKVNLRLKILGRETTGYHSIETLFHRIELADRVTVRVAAQRSARSIDCAGVEVGAPEQNLAFQAACAFADATGWPRGFSIEIEKRIPVGGGLGGGSADAGAVLRALESMAPAPLGGRLMELAASLGSDVPFLTLDQPYAFGWGRGERLLPLEPPEPRAVAVIIPDFAVATAQAYRWLTEDRGAYVPRAEVIDLAACSDWAGLATLAVNDFDAVICRRHPALASALAGLRDAGALVAMVAGSGSSVFGIFATETAAQDALTKAGAGGVVTRLATPWKPLGLPQQTDARNVGLVSRKAVS